MARGGHGGDRVLESRHLVGLFLAVVVLCGVFFTLGYVMGRAQYPVHADRVASSGAAPARAAARNASQPGTGAAAPNDWDFYPNKDENHPEAGAGEPAADSSSGPAPLASAAKPEKLVAATPKPVIPRVERTSRFAPPRIPRGSVVLQLAALRHSDDANVLAGVLRKKRFPCFVLPPSTDDFYRVQVGPYRDVRAAESAQKALDRAGFRAILKR